MTCHPANTPDIVEIDCFEPLPSIVLSHNIYGRGDDARLIARAAELGPLNPVLGTMRMLSCVRAYTTGMLLEVREARRLV